MLWAGHSHQISVRISDCVFDIRDTQKCHEDIRTPLPKQVIRLAQIQGKGKSDLCFDRRSKKVTFQRACLQGVVKDSIHVCNLDHIRLAFRLKEFQWNR